MKSHQFPIEDYVRYPASDGRTGAEHLFIKDGVIIGYAKPSSANGMGDITFCYEEGPNMAFCANDPLVIKNPEIAFFRFNAAFGEYTQTFTDEPEGRMEGVSIINARDFEFGIASKLRYGHMKGFGIYDKEHRDHYQNQILIS